MREMSDGLSHRVNIWGQEIGEPVPDWKAPMRPDESSLAGRLCIVERLDADRHSRALFCANEQDREGRMWTYLPHGPFAGYDDYRAWLVAAQKSADPWFYAIVDRASNKAVGLASYLRVTPEAGSIEVGALVFSPLLQRTAMATEAMVLMMTQAFALGYRRYEWKCDALNAASRRAALRLGFQYEGTFRKAVVIKGRNRDTAWYSVTDDGWPALREVFARWLAPSNFDGEGRQRERLSDLTGALRQREE